MTKFEIGTLVISSLAFLLSLLTYLNTIGTKKELFKDLLRENIKKAKHEILTLNCMEKNHMERIRIIEIFHDLLFYQGYGKEKKAYLSVQENEQLSLAQLDIEDCASCIFACSDVDTNKQQARDVLNKLLETI